MRQLFPQRRIRFANSPVEPGWPLAALAFAVVVIAVAGLPL